MSLFIVKYSTNDKRFGFILNYNQGNVNMKLYLL